MVDHTWERSLADRYHKESVSESAAEGGAREDHDIPRYINPCCRKHS